MTLHNTVKGAFLFDPDEYKGLKESLVTEDYRLSPDELIGFGRTVTDLRE